MAFQLSKFTRPFAAISVAASLLAGIVFTPSQAEAGECYRRTTVSLSYGEAAINNIDHRLDSNGMNAGFCLSRDKKKILLGSWYAPDQRFVQHTMKHHVKSWVKRMEARRLHVRGLPLIDKNDNNLLVASVDAPLQLHPHVKPKHRYNDHMMAAVKKKSVPTAVAAARHIEKPSIKMAKAGNHKTSHIKTAAAAPQKPINAEAQKIAQAQPSKNQESVPVRNQVGAQWVQNAGTQISYNITYFFDGLRL